MKIDKFIFRSITVRLALYSWLLIAFLASVVVGFQMSHEYNHSKIVIEKQFKNIKNDYLTILSKSLWDYSFEYANLYTEVIKNLPFVSYVALVNDANKVISFYSDEKITKKEEVITKDFNKDNMYKVQKYNLSYDGIRVGVLHVGVNLHKIRSSYIKKAKDFAFQGFIKSFIACFILFQLFKFLILKHILHIVNFLKVMDLKVYKELKLNRPVNIQDELQLVVDTINSQNKKIFKTQEELFRINENLASEVEIRTKERDQERQNVINSARLASLGTMAGGIAHEINNPLNVISSTLSFIKKAKRKGKLTDERFDHSVEEIYSMVKRVNEIVEGLKKISRNDSGGCDTSVVVNECINDVLKISRLKIENSKIDLILNNLDIFGDEAVKGNLVQLSQVLINLLNNSIDAISELDKKWISINVKKENDFIVISVADSGAGIPEGIRSTIFDPFFTSKEVGKGTGLGLSLSKQIIESFEGELKLNSNVKNTCFEIYLKHIV